VLGSQALLERSLWLIPLILSLSIHEFAHAWTAWRLGDDTASLAGRMTLNPIAHIDLVGTILLPLFSPIPFGWAKPVPVNPARFRRGVSMGRGMAITAAAGPISNLLLAFIVAVAFALVSRVAPDAVGPDTAAFSLIVVSIEMNVNLALFNLIPIPPLDGSRIVDGYMPYRLRPRWEAITRYSPFLLVAVIFLGGRLIAGPSAFVLDLVGQLIQAIRAV
jgi:Zn-dependent protease